MNESLSKDRASMGRRLIFALIGSLLGGMAGFAISVIIVVISLPLLSFPINEYKYIDAAVGVVSVVSGLVAGAIINIRVTSRFLRVNWRNAVTQLIVPYLMITIGVVLLAFLHGVATNNQWVFLHVWAIFYVLVIFGSLSSLLGCIAVAFRKSKVE